MLGSRIVVRSVSDCYTCGRPGEWLYSGLRDVIYGAEGLWSFRRCSGCGSVWLDPQPVPEDLPNVYPDNYLTHSEQVDGSAIGGLRTSIKLGVLAAAFGYGGVAPTRWAGILGNLASSLTMVRDSAGGVVMWLDGTTRGRLLDIGCGNGRFLATMKELGWEVVGFEPDPVAARIARERFGLEVADGALEHAGFADASFDAVTMSHVIEHVPDPITTLRQCRRLLKPGGRLVLLTPNAASLGHRRFRNAWLGLDPPRHLFIFSPPALATVADKAGLRVLSVRTIARSAWWNYAASRNRQRRLSHKELKRGSPWLSAVPSLAFWAWEDLAVRVRACGEEIMMTGTRPPA